jgi:hypothetical protein
VLRQLTNPQNTSAASLLRFARLRSTAGETPLSEYARLKTREEKNMPSDHVQICHYTSDDPRGQFVDLMRFVKNELCGIGTAAMEKGHGGTYEVAEDAIEALDRLWRKAAQCKGFAEPYPSEQDEAVLSDVAERAMFELTVKRHWGWLYENWRTVLPKN